MSELKLQIAEAPKQIHPILKFSSQKGKLKSSIFSGTYLVPQTMKGDQH
jgi:hypothetical protein